MSVIILQVIPSLIGYIIIVQTFNCATRSFPEHNFRWWAKLTSIFLVISFHLEQQSWPRVCVVSVAPIIFCCISPFAWCSRWSIASSWIPSTTKCRDHHQHSELFQDIYRILDEKYHPCPRWFVLSSTILLPSIQHKLVRVLCCTLSSLLSNYVMFYLGVLPYFMSKMLWEFHHLLRNSCCSDASRHHHSFLVPVLVLTRIPTDERCYLDSALLATLLLWS